jgi:hypothetical protein
MDKCFEKDHVGVHLMQEYNLIVKAFPWAVNAIRLAHAKPPVCSRKRYSKPTHDGFKGICDKVRRIFGYRKEPNRINTVKLFNKSTSLRSFKRSYAENLCLRQSLRLYSFP